MKLKFLELQGFKTFPNKTTIKFVDGISAVVGPNGSGKSNISDAVRWVLGEQSVKNLRCNKLEDVIFAGSGSKGAQGLASVRLVFDNKDGCVENLDDEISIMRRYSRSGESEYFINMKPARLRDINELFMDTGMGKDGYSIIGQGKIDEIISSKASERREIFEEAAGISGCRYKKEDAICRLNQAEDNLKRVKDILYELESRVEPLKRQSDKAELYMQYSESKRGLEISLWMREIDSYRSGISQHKEKLEIIRDKKRETEQILLEFEKKIEQCVYNSNLCIAGIDECRRNISQADEDISKNNSELMILKNNIENNVESIRKYESEIGENKDELTELDRQINEKSDLFDKKSSDIQVKNESLERMIQDLEKIKDKFFGRTGVDSDIESELKSAEKQKSDTDIEKLLAQSQLEDAESRCESIGSALESKKAELKRAKEHLEDKNRAASEISQKLEALIKDESVICSDLDAKTEQYNVKKNALQKLILDSGSELRKIKLLEELRQNLEGFSHSVKSVMKESGIGNIRGIIDTVSNVLKVPAGYATAIDISLGAAAQNIITENEESAKSAINFLKKGKLGRATFLPITSVRGSRAELKDTGVCRGILGIAGDLCEYDDRYKNIINYLLGRIIIADNIDNAVVIARNFSNRFKVVTLDGQVINVGGSLTGGSVSSKTGLISRSSEIEELKKNYDKINKKKLDLEKETHNLKKHIDENKSSLSRRKEEIEKIRTEKNSLMSDISVLSNQINNYKISIKELNDELQSQAEKKENLSGKINKYDETFTVLDEKINGLKVKLAQVQSVKTKFEKQSEEKNLEIQKLRTELLMMQNETDVISVEMSSLKNKREENIRRIDKLSLQIDNIKVQNRDMGEQAGLLDLKIEEISEKKESLCKKVEKIKAERESLEKVSSQLRKDEKDKSHINENLVKELSRLEERGINMQKEYDTTVAKLWDEYNLTLGEAKGYTLDIEDLGSAKKELSILKSKIKALGEVNTAAVDEYKEVNERYLFMREQVEDIERSKKALVNVINNLNKDMKDMFVSKFDEINKNFSYIVNELFGGGCGRLTLEDSEDVLSCGINISVQVPGKKEIHLEALSGGEKVLVAISLYFAIIKVNPPPFCVLDEIEAALDDVNVDRFAKYIRKVCEKTQFIVITHRRGTMEESDALYGVTMEEEGISKLLELRVNEVINA